MIDDTRFYCERCWSSYATSVLARECWAKHFATTNIRDVHVCYP